jgi:dihydrofolate reductase
MRSVTYSMGASLDGYIVGPDGSFNWTEPDPEVFRFWIDEIRDVGVHLLGRRLYETMVYWESPANTAGEPAVVQEYGKIWRAADKVVYSRSLETVSSTRTRIEREFDPAAVRRLKETPSGVLGIGGAELAAQAIAAGLVDEYQLFLVPVVVGAGKRALPDAHLSLELLDERRFGNGTVYLRYAASS